MEVGDPIAQRQGPVDWHPLGFAPDAPAPGSVAVVKARRIDPVIVFAVVGFALVGAIALAVSAYLVFAVGTVAVVIAAVMALVPLLIVLTAVGWIDRWEPEPKPALLFALLWGAAASVAIALIFSFLTQLVSGMSGDESFGAVFVSTVIQAPVVEEAAKGFGVLLLFWVFRRQFEGPVDGLVYGAMVAVGFAFTENIQYFGLALGSGDVAGVGEIFFLRGVLSPFAHVMFTAITGIVLGFASRRSSGAGAIGYFLLGLAPAILLHAFWNGASLLVNNFYGYYVVVQVPLFLSAVAFVVFLRRQERAVTAGRLADYGQAGWFTPFEVALLSTPEGRRYGTAWAGRFGLADQFRSLTRNATRLAFARQRIVSSRERDSALRAEARLLAAITADRHALAALPPLPQG